MTHPDWETRLEDARGKLGEPVTLGWALVFCALGMALAFLLGRAHPEEDYRRIAENLEEARQDARAARNGRAAAEREARALLARADLNKSAATSLARRIETAEREKTDLAERVAFYQRLFGERNPNDGELAIQALEVAPAFHPNRHHLSAVLLRNGDARKAFEGRYYFEAVERNGAGEESRIVRVPPEGAELAFDFYLEIEEQLELNPNREIENVRLVVTDLKGRQVAESVLIENNGAAGGRGGSANNEAAETETESESEAESETESESESDSESEPQ